VTAPEDVGVECLSPYPTRDRRGRTNVVLGDLTSDERVAVVLRLHFPYGEIGHSTGALFAVSDRDEVMTQGGTRLTWEYADDKANDARERDREVDRAVARIFAARARQEAVGRNRLGDFTGARDVIKATARRIHKYAGRDAELRTILTDLEAELDRFDKPMLEVSLKMAYAQSSYAVRSRDALGKAMKVDRPPRS
jgi:hypothetical protein